MASSTWVGIWQRSEDTYRTMMHFVRYFAGFYPRAILLRRCAWLLLGMFFVLGSLQAQKRAADTNLDSLQQLLRSAANDTADLSALEALAEYHIREDKDLALQYAKRLVALAPKRQQSIWLVRGYKAISNVYLIASTYDSALYYNALGIQTMEEQGVRDEALELRLLINRGAIFTYASAHDSALVYCLAAYNLSEALGAVDLKSKILNNLGVIYRKIDRPEAARKTYRESLALKTSVGDSLGMATTLGNLGIVEMQLGLAQTALTSFRQAKQVYKAIDRPEEALAVDLNIGQAYFAVGDKASARLTWENALAQPNIRADARTLAYTFLGLADIANDTADPIALDYARQGRAYAAYLSIPRLQADYDRVSADYFMKRQQLDSAAFYYAQYASQIDSVYAEERSQAEQEVAERFESQLREAEIEQQQLIIERQKQRQILLSIVALGAALLASVLFFLFRYRLRLQRSEADKKNLLKNKEIEALQKTAELKRLKAMLQGQEAERSRIAQDLHDGLGGLLATVKVRLNTEENNVAAADKLLDRACAEVRRIAHNMAPQNLQLIGLSAAVEDIAAQLRLQGLDCELELGGQPSFRLSEEEQLMLLRIVQELTHNIAKHAQAEKVFIQLLDQPHQLLLTVEDDGQGFDASTAKGQGLGLASIQSRVDYLKGQILFDSSPGVGTTVTLTIPL